MRLPEGRRRSYFRWGCALFALIALMVYGYYQLQARGSSSSEAQAIVESVHVAGFTRTATDSLSDGRTSKGHAYFIGPGQNSDPLAVVTIPTIQLRAVAPTPNPTPWESDKRLSVVVARGERSDGCRATVSYGKNLQLDPSRSEFNLTAEQFNAVRDGTQVFVMVYVSNCGA